MALGKSDKIIAIVGVIILIIAAIGIFLYPTEKEVKEVAPEKKTFDVMWVNTSGTVPANQLGQLSATKKADYTKTITISAPPGSVLTKVEFKLDWTDDVTYRGIFSKGLDTLTAKIAPADGGKDQSYTSEGKGNKKFSFDVVDIPQDETVDAENISEATQLVEGKYIDKNKASFKVTVTVEPGEKLRRPLKFLLDKGNSFNLKVTYEYYSLQIIEEEYEEPPEETETAHQAYMITNLVHF